MALPCVLVLECVQISSSFSRFAVWIDTSLPMPFDSLFSMVFAVGYWQSLQEGATGLFLQFLS